MCLGKKVEIGLDPLRGSIGVLEHTSCGEREEAMGPTKLAFCQQKDC